MGSSTNGGEGHNVNPSAPKPSGGRSRKAGEVVRVDLVKKDEGTKPGGGVGGRRDACSYEKGGKCLLHGTLGRQKWKPRGKTVVDDKGRKPRERDGRDTFWVCDVGDKGLRRQLKISFAKITPGDTQGGLRDSCADTVSVWLELD